VKELVLVVLGAGASYDAIRPDHYRMGRPADWKSLPMHARAPFDERWRPPLAIELFDDRDDSFGKIAAVHWEAGPLIQRLQRAIRGGENVEVAMRAVEAQAKTSKLGRVQLAALGLYVQDVLLASGAHTRGAAHQLTNLGLLADQLEKWRSAAAGRRISYVTFNYDTLLEEACRPFRSFGSVDGYVFEAGRTPQATRVYKVHGSANWGWRIGASIGVAPGIPYKHELLRLVEDGFVPSAELAMSGSMHSVVLDAPQTVSSEHVGGGPGGVSGYVLYPAVVLPVVRKTSFIIPSHHLDQLAADLKSATAILVIGWKAEDPHFLTLLKKALRPNRPTHVVGGTANSATVEQRLRKAARTARTAAFSSGFSAYIDDPDNLNSLLRSRVGITKSPAECP
jgi:hypothetical protein